MKESSLNIGIMILCQILRLDLYLFISVYNKDDTIAVEMFTDEESSGMVDVYSNAGDPVVTMGSDGKKGIMGISDNIGNLIVGGNRRRTRKYTCF